MRIVSYWLIVRRWRREGCNASCRLGGCRLQQRTVDTLRISDSWWLSWLPGAYNTVRESWAFAVPGQSTPGISLIQTPGHRPLSPSLHVTLTLHCELWYKGVCPAAIVRLRRQVNDIWAADSTSRPTQPGVANVMYRYWKQRRVHKLSVGKWGPRKTAGRVVGTPPWWNAVTKELILILRSLLAVVYSFICGKN